MRPGPIRFPIVPRPAARSVLVAALAVLVGVVVARTVAHAEATVARLGPTATVLVADTLLRPGMVLDLDSVTVATRPVAHIPPGAMTGDPADAVGATVRDTIRPGQIVLAADLVDATDPDGLVAADHRSVAVPRDGAGLPVQIGDRVDVVVVTFDERTGTDRADTVADAALVVDVTDDAVVVSVPEEQVGRVVAGVGAGFVALALAG